LQPPDEEREFIVGDNSSSPGSFLNLPLKPGTPYQVTLVAVNRQDNDYGYSIAKLPHPVYTSPIEEKVSSEVVWAALLLLLLIPAVVYFIYRSVACVTLVTECSAKLQETHSVAGRKCVLFFFHYHSHDVSETCQVLSVECYITCTPWQTKSTGLKE
jgi:hypothetical protein